MIGLFGTMVQQSLCCVWFGAFDLFLWHAGQTFLSMQLPEFGSMQCAVCECVELIPVVQIDVDVLHVSSWSQTTVACPVEAPLRAF